MKSSESEPTQQQKPLGEKEKPPMSKPPGDIWRPYERNPDLEINNQGKLRTKNYPLPK